VSVGRPATRAIPIRTTLTPGDVGAIVRMHGLVYSREHGFDATFEAYVAAPLAEFARHRSLRERIWIAEGGAGIAGVVAIVDAGDGVAQLRWFLVDPAARGLGLGTALLSHAVAFARESGYTSIILWTVRALEAAARLYRAEGFRLVEERPGRHWGLDVIEERYELELSR
jgi:GNAT superfamily N-acetyltransferase